MKRANYAELLRNSRAQTQTNKTTARAPAVTRREKTSKTMKRGKLTGKAKAAFLARMKRGRKAAGISESKPSRARSSSPRKPASSRRPAKPQKVSVTRARAGKPKPGGRGGGKHVPVKLDIQISEKERATKARGKGGKRKGGSGHSRKNKHGVLYENPMTGMELVVGGAFVGIGAVVSRFADRWMATRPVIAALTPAAGATAATTLSLNDAVNSVPGFARWGLQAGLCAAPLVGSYFAPPMVRTILQGTALGVFGNMFTMAVEHLVLVKLFAPKTNAGALSPIANSGTLTSGATAPTMMQRLYNDEIQADADKATTAATTGGSVSGLPRPRALPSGIRRSMVDPGPVARRAGVGQNGGNGGGCAACGTAAPPNQAPATASPGCVIDPTCGVPAGADTTAGASQIAGAAAADAGCDPSVITPPADQMTGTGLGEFGYDSWDDVVQNAAA
jgi:hypothetical protein